MARHNILVWYSEVNVLGARQWHDEIGKALSRCDWFLIMLSPESVKSMWVKREFMYALRKERFNDRIIPLICEPCDFEDLSWVLPDFQIVNFHKRFENGCRDLLRIWNVDYKPLA